MALLLGNPVDRSLSPLIHNTSFSALGINAEFRVARVEAHELALAIERLRAEDALGANVTIPYKRAATHLVDDLTREAADVGAVNTIVSTEGRLTGANTDIEGFLGPLAPFVGDLRGRNAVVFGAGGSARAVFYALLAHVGPGRLTVAARRIGQARRLIADLGAWKGRCTVDAVPLAEAATAVREASLIVNATPVGMAPASDQSPWPAPSDFQRGAVVFDLVYAPAETRLLAEAQLAGARPIGGLEMLLWQAAGSFRLWTGREMPVDLVRERLDRIRIDP